MANREIPVYLFTGFMDSGKTSLIQETLFENNFAEGGKGIIIMCEDGDVEYDLDKLATVNFSLVTIDNEEDFTDAKLKEINEQYKPDQVFIEYNGTWGAEKILEATLPKNWVMVQALATVDSTTFESYWNNMRAMMQEQVFEADVVIFNRTDDNTDRGKLRRQIKTVNRKAQIVYERTDGSIDEREEELPFDINQEVIELSDADYGIWYMDAVDNYKKYHGKKVKFLALVYNPDNLKSGVMVPGRFAMTCCADDITFIGFKCKYPKEKEIAHKSWITITAEVRVEFAMEYKGKGPVLYPISIEPAEKPEDELVYFT
ncbi:MAG: GTPase [Agathobacter sp.]|nr:GTPase [Agathobacter sp.]